MLGVELITSQAIRCKLNRFIILNHCFSMVHLTKFYTKKTFIGSALDFSCIEKRKIGTKGLPDIKENS
jgi:hypothetical protein